MKRQPPNYERLFERIPWFKMTREELLQNENQLNLEIEEWYERGRISKKRRDHYIDLLNDTIDMWLDVRANHIGRENIEDGKGYRIPKDH